MSADGRIPPAGQKVLVHGTLLKVDVAVTVYDMQMHDRVQQFYSTVDVPAAGTARNLAGRLDYGQKRIPFGNGKTHGVFCRGEGISFNLEGRI
jgi:hypothetical protein